MEKPVLKMLEDDHSTLVALVRELNHLVNYLKPGGYLPDEGVMDSFTVANNGTIGGTLQVTGGTSLGGYGPNYGNDAGYIQFAQIDITTQYGGGWGVFHLIGARTAATAASVFIRFYRQEAMSTSGFGASYRTLLVGDLFGWTASQIVGVLTSDTSSLKQVKFYVPAVAYSGLMVHPTNIAGDIKVASARVSALPAGTQYTATAV